MTLARVITCSALLLVATAVPARADITAFLGANTTPSNRPVRGFAVGAGLVIAAFEFEYANTAEDTATAAPALTTGMVNGLLQPPFPVMGLQPYVTAGIGLARETLGLREETGLGVNAGGGLKVDLVGPLRLRIDYRVLRLGSTAIASPATRIYAGLNIKF